MTALDDLDYDGWRSLAGRDGKGREQRRPIRVLIVDDHFLFAEMLAMALQLDDRYEVVGHAHDGREAVELAAWLRPDLVLMDVKMPVLDGLEATPRVLAASPRSKVVVVSSSDAPDDRERARRAGAVGFISKEVSAGDLPRAVDSVVSSVVPLRRGRGSPPPIDVPAT
jgi:DNA-binding NarL/FixJ family response regulator